MKLLHRPWNIFYLISISFFISCSSEKEDTSEVITFNNGFTQNLILDWSTMWLEMDGAAAGMRPCASARSLAYIHLAAYETAIADMPNYISNTTRLDGLSIEQNLRKSNVNLEVALNACYAKSLEFFVYNLPLTLFEKAKKLAKEKQQFFETKLSKDIIEASSQWGIYVADQVITYSKTDLEASKQIPDPQPTSYKPPIGEGNWTHNHEAERALFPYWNKTRTFVITPEKTTSLPPMVYNEDINSDYYKEVKEVYDINNKAKEKQDEQLWIAEFWSDDVDFLMMSPPGRQISIATQLIDQQNLKYEESLALLLKLSFSLNDAAVSTWDDKYKYMTMRPNIYIKKSIDADYQTNLFKLVFWPNPSFPSYPSGHSCFASAAAGVFINQFGDNINFTDKTHENKTKFNGTPRKYTSLSEMAKENAFSRIPLGVHMRMDCVEGLRLGYEISDAVNKMQLTP